VAIRALTGVGNPAAGEWSESNVRAFHLRRRLTPAEEELVGPAVDIRGTGEARARVDRVMRWVAQTGNPEAVAVALDEAGLSG
jgi:hypothetical protein